MYIISCLSYNLQILYYVNTKQINIMAVTAVYEEEHTPDLYNGSKGIGPKESEHFLLSSW